MLRWLGPRKASEPPDGRLTNAAGIAGCMQNGGGEEVTDDPLAVLDTGNRHRRGQRQIYSVSRINPLFQDSQKLLLDNNNKASENIHRAPIKERLPHQTSGEKSSSSGYGGSHGGSSLDPIYVDHQLKHREDTIAVALEEQQNSSSAGQVTKLSSTRVVGGKTGGKSVPSMGSGSSAAGTLTTIPEGKVDLPVPKPIWPPSDIDVLGGRGNSYDSIVDEALLLYTSLNHNNNPETQKNFEDCLDVSVKEILIDLLNSINATMDGKTGLTPDDLLKSVNNKIATSIEALKISTEEEMKKLCINLSNCRRINSVLRAFSNSSTSGNSSSQSSPEWSRGVRERTLSSETEDFYQIPSGSSSSGFSDYLKEHPNALPMFVHEDLSSVPNGVRNAMIYGTLYRARSGSGGVNLKNVSNNIKDTQGSNSGNVPKKCSLRAVNDNKPSVWEQYYGVKATQEGDVKYVTKPTDVPLFLY